MINKLDLHQCLIISGSVIFILVVLSILWYFLFIRKTYKLIYKVIINPITDSQKEQLFKITPSKDFNMEYRPCQVKLKNGDIYDNVYIQEEQSYFKAWGIMPDEDSGKDYLLIEDVVEVRESPNRLPPDLANKIYEAGESGMGYCFFKLIFDNGTDIIVCTGNAVDFVPLPKGLTAYNIKDVVPHPLSRRNYEHSPKYYWCLFKD